MHLSRPHRWLSLFAALLVVCSGFVVLQVSSGSASAASNSVVKPGASSYTQAELLHMTPLQLANIGVPEIKVGTGVTVASGASPEASPEAKVVYASIVSTSKQMGTEGMLPDLLKLPVSTVAAYQAAYQNIGAPFTDLYYATLSVIATSASLGITPDLSSQFWWTLGGVACGATAAVAIVAALAIAGSLIVTSGMSAVLIVAAGLVAAAACAITVAEELGWFTQVHQVGSQTVYNQGVINKSYAAFTNGIITTGTMANQFFSELPFMQYMLFRLADEAAISQIGNTTFNPVLNLIQSGIIPGFADAQFVALTASLNQQLQLMSTQANTITSGGSHADTFQWNGATLANNTNVFGVSGGPLFINSADQNSTILADYFSPSSAAPTCPLGAGGPQTLPTLTVIPGTSKGWAVNSNTAKACIAGPHAAIESFAGDYAGSAAVNGTGGQGSDASGYGGFKSYILPTDGVPFCPTTGYCPQAANGTQYAIFPARGVGANGGSLAGFKDTLTGNIVNSTLVNTNLISTAYNNFAALEINAVSSAKLYWQFLRSQGITNPNNVPAVDILITPAQLMSSGICVQNVSIYGGTNFKGPCLNLGFNQSYALYLAWLYDMGVFNATNYQKAQPLTCDSAGSCTFWGNLNLYGFGNVYIPGAAPENTSIGAETFSNPASWAMINTQLLFFPQLLDPDQIKIYNASWEVPKAAPLAVFGTHDRLFEPLIGNGTINGTAVPGSAAGAAIDLKYCVLLKKNVTAASGSCEAFPYTVNFTVGTLLCGANTQACFTTPPFATAASCDPFGISASLSFLGPFACAAAWIVDLVIIVIGIAIVVAVARVAFQRGPRRMRGG